MPNRSELIQIRVTPGEKQQITEFVEETNEYESVSRMLRALAHRHIATDGDMQQEASVDPDEIVDAVDTAMTDVTDQIERVEDTVAELESSVDMDDEIGQLAHEIMSQLPVHESGDDLPDPTTEIDKAAGGELLMAQQLSTVDAWATYLEIPVDKARRALARAQEFPDVQYVEGSRGYRRYYKTSEGVL